MSKGDCSRQSAALPTSLWVDSDCSRQSAALPTSLWVDSDCSRQSAALPTSLWVAGVVVALPEELTTLTSRKMVQGECFALNDSILIFFAGAGPVNAKQAAHVLISKGVNVLISWGCAAALSNSLKPGDLLVPDQVLSEQGLIYDINKEWLQHIQHVLPEKLPVFTGALTESCRIIAESREKQRMHTLCGAVALDMESAAVIEAAHQAGLPGLVIRAIADPAMMDLPQAVVHALNSQGRIELTKLLRYLLTHPWEIPALIKLGLHFNKAEKTLKTVAKQLNDIINFRDKSRQ